MEYKVKNINILYMIRIIRASLIFQKGCKDDARKNIDNEIIKG